MKPNLLLSVRAYGKIVLHACKYPHKAVCGVLLGSEAGHGGRLHIQDAVPLFHLGLGLSPMLEAALLQVDEFCSSSELSVVGYYQANELLDNSLPDNIAFRVADKVQENFSNALLLMPDVCKDVEQTRKCPFFTGCVLNPQPQVDNRKISVACDDMAVRVYKMHDGKWKITESSVSCLEGGPPSVQIVSSLMQQKAYHSIVDFDNHFDDIRLDWRNPSINSLIELELSGSGTA